MLTRLLLLAPHEQPGFGTTRGERIERRLMRAFVKEFWQRLFFRTAHVHRFAINNLRDRKSTRLNSSHEWISYAVFCLKKKKQKTNNIMNNIPVSANVHSKHYRQRWNV